MKNKVFFIIVSVAISLLFGVSSAHAIDEGGKCNSSKFGNSLVMKNGKIHGGQFGPNVNYSGPLYLCQETWIYWTTATPAKSSSKKEATVDVRPGQFCSSLGKEVMSSNHGKLRCIYFRVGKVKSLMWMET